MTSAAIILARQDMTSVFSHWWRTQFTNSQKNVHTALWNTRRLNYIFAKYMQPLWGTVKKFWGDSHQIYTKKNMINLFPYFPFSYVQIFIKLILLHSCLSTISVLNLRVILYWCIRHRCLWILSTQSRVFKFKYGAEILCYQYVRFRWDSH